MMMMIDAVAVVRTHRREGHIRRRLDCERIGVVIAHIVRLIVMILIVIDRLRANGITRVHFFCLFFGNKLLLFSNYFYDDPVLRFGLELFSGKSFEI